MKLKLNALYAEEQHFQWEVSQEWIKELLQSDVDEGSVEAELYAASGPMDMQVWVHRNDEDVFFRATLTGEIKCMCVRCLEFFGFPVSLELQGIFIMPEHDSYETPDEPFTYFYDGGEIDFSQPVRENIFLEIPQNPSCEMVLDSCVGEPLKAIEEQTSEADEETTIDPRWAALQELKSSLKK